MKIAGGGISVLVPGFCFRKRDFESPASRFLGATGMSSDFSSALIGFTYESSTLSQLSYSGKKSEVIVFY